MGPKELQDACDVDREQVQGKKTSTALVRDYECGAGLFTFIKMTRE